MGIGVAARTILALTMAVMIPPFLSPDRATAKDEWVSPHFRDHPLAGTIWTSDFEAVTMSQLEALLSKSSFVLLGEIHNNPDHHRLQARLINGLVGNGRRPAIVFEMIPGDLQAELDRQAQGGLQNAGKLGEALRWKERGWPDWAIYQPIAEAALSAQLPLLAGGLDANTQKVIAKAEPPSIYTQTMNELDLARPLKPEIVAAQGREIDEAHCNLLPKAAMEPMLRVQRARDAYLAKAMLSAKASDGAVLIAGAGHARNDWAVPLIIRQKLADAAVVSIAFIEVDPKLTSPSEYIQTVAGSEKPYDFIYLTPRADLTDHCAGLAKQLETKKSGQR